MKLSVEFLGLSRELTGEKEIQVQLDSQSTCRDLLRHLAATYPNLIGPVITTDPSEPHQEDRPHYCLSPSYMFNADGRAIVRDLDTSVQNGQHLLLMFAEAGG